MSWGFESPKDPSALLTLTDIAESYQMPYWQAVNIVYAAAAAGELHALRRQQHPRIYYALWEVERVLEAERSLSMRTNEQGRRGDAREHRQGASAAPAMNDDDLWGRWLTRERDGDGDRKQDDQDDQPGGLSVTHPPASRSF